MSLGTLTPTLAQMIVDAINAALYDLHTGLPARVVAFDAEHRSCDVQPLLRRVILDEDDQPQELSMPQISNVPVIYPAGGSWSITFPLVAGDIVFLAFAERSLDRWLSAAPGSEVDPLDARHHALSDAIAIPGIRPRTAPQPTVDGTNLRIAHESGTVVLELTPDTVHVRAPNVSIDAGGDADQPMVRGTDLLQWLTTHTHPTAALGPPSPPALPPPPVILSATAKVK